MITNLHIIELEDLLSGRGPEILTDSQPSSSRDLGSTYKIKFNLPLNILLVSPSLPTLTDGYFISCVRFSIVATLIFQENFESEFRCET